MLIFPAACLRPALRAWRPPSEAARLIARAGLDPRNGVTPGQVAVAGYAEPSLVFLLGSDPELDIGAGAAQALEVGRPALVEQRQATAFHVNSPATTPGRGGGRGGWR